MTEAEKFAAVLRDEGVRRVDDRYVHNAIIRDQMRAMADRIERWERLEFNPPDAHPMTCHHAEQIRDLLEEREELLTEIRRLRMGNHPAGRALRAPLLSGYPKSDDPAIVALTEALTERDAEHEGGGGT